MIIRSETDLTPSEYEAVTGGRYNPSAKVMVYQYNPNFSSVGTVFTGAAEPTDFADYGGFGYRIRGSLVEKIAQDGTITDLSYTPPGDWITSKPLSIAADANGVAVFAACTAGLKRSLYTGSWATTTLSTIPYTKNYTLYTDSIFDSLASDSTGNNALFAFDSIFTNYWEATSLPAQLGSGTGNLAASRYSVMSGALVDAAPKSWTFQGWNGSSWVTIQTVSNQPPWMAFETRTFTIASPVAYTKLRLNVSAVYSGTSVQVGSLTAELQQTFSLPQDMVMLSAASTEAVFFLREVPQRNLFLLCAAIYEDGAWVYKESDIYWPGLFNEMKAIPRNGGGYIITAVTLIPGPMTVKSTGATTETYVYKKQGIVSFIFENNTFSDHFDVDVSDFYTGWRKREKITLMNINGLTYMVSVVTDGSEEYPNAMYQAYTTLDGKFWSIGEAFYIPSDFSTPVYLAPNQDVTILAMMNKETQSSPHTRLFGGSAISADLSPHVEALNLTFSDMGSGSMDVANNVLQYENNPSFNVNNAYEIEVWAGYTTNGTKAMVRVLKGDIDTILPARSGGERIISVSFRDNMNRITDRFKSRNARELRTALVFQDDFTNTVDNVYGGLRNTAGHDGSWESKHLCISGSTGDGISSGVGEALAFSTATIDMWNGVHEAWIDFQRNGTPAVGNTGLWFLYYSDEPRKRMETIWATDEPPLTSGQVDFPIGWTPPYYDSNTNFYGFFVGYVKSKAATGKYNFRLEYSGKASLYISGELLANGHAAPSETSVSLSGTAEFDTANKLYPIYIPFSTWPRNGGTNSVKLYWSPPGEAEALVPYANLCKATASDGNFVSTGLVFRAVDKRNFYALSYEPFNERLVLKRRTDGIDHTLDIADLSSIGWDADPEAPRKMYVVFRYGRVRVYANNEYREPLPVLRIDHLLDMRGLKIPDAQGLIPLKDVPPEAGYVGYLGQGQ